MSRFEQPQDELFRRLNSSIAFDYRLAPYDLEQSMAHVRMLARSGIISDEERAQLEELGERIEKDATAGERAKTTAALLRATKRQVARRLEAGERVRASELRAIADLELRLAQLEQFERLRELTRER